MGWKLEGGCTGHLASLPSHIKGNEEWRREEGANECPLGGAGRPLVLALGGLSPSDASPCVVVEGGLQELGSLWEPSLFWGVGPTVVLDSFGGRVFLIF